MSNKTIIAIVVVILVLVAGYFVINMRATAPTNSSATTEGLGTNNSQNSLNELEQENSTQDMSGIDADIGAEINAAAK